MLSVVIPTTNRPDSLIRLVESLQLQNMVRASFEVLVVYNSELQKKSSPLKDSSLVQLLCAPHPGVNHARNHGALHARGSVILFLDDDCEVTDPAFLQKHFAYHHSFSHLAAVGGPYLLTQNSSLCDQIYHANNANWIHANLTETSRSSALLGGNASYKAFIFANGFRFTEEIIYGGSETPLNTILALKFGAHGYFLDLAVYHNTQLNLHSLLRKAFLQGIGAAVQTKMYGHQLKQLSAGSYQAHFFLRAGLELYALFFILGYQSQFSDGNRFLLFLKTLVDRYVKNKLMTGLRNHAVQLYWWLYSLCSKTFWRLHSITLASYGFFQSMFEPLPLAPRTPIAVRFSYRCIFICKKLGWLAFKTVGLK